MNITEFQDAMRVLLTKKYVEQMADEAFWERAVCLFAGVANPRIDAREQQAKEAKQIERERRLAVVMGWSGYIWKDAQIAAIRDYVNDGVVTMRLPRQYREKDSASRGR